MTVHMFRVFVGRGKMAVSDLETRIGDWIAANPEWTEDHYDHRLEKRNTANDGGGETYYAVDVRFTEVDTKSNLLQKFTDKLKEKVAWYRVTYHSCPHDEGSPFETDCNWSSKAEWAAKDTTIPNGVPDYNVG